METLICRVPFVVQLSSCYTAPWSRSEIKHGLDLAWNVSQRIKRWGGEPLSAYNLLLIAPALRLRLSPWSFMHACNNVFTCSSCILHERGVIQGPQPPGAIFLWWMRAQARSPAPVYLCLWADYVAGRLKNIWSPCKDGLQVVYAP